MRGRKKSLVSLLLVFILFFAGMYFEGVKIHSCFETPAQDGARACLLAESVHFAEANVSISMEPVAGIQGKSCVRQYVKRPGDRGAGVRGLLLFFRAAGDFQEPRSRGRICWVVNATDSGHEHAVQRYIHSKDGKKRA